MAKKFSELRAKMPKDAQERVAKRNAEEIKRLSAKMPLQELRQARGLSQTLLAEYLGVGEPTVSTMEKHTDKYISTLRSHIRAMGGELEVIATFPEGSVKIASFSEL